MSIGAFALQSKIYSTLNGDSNLTSTLGVSIYDDVPESSSFPYIQMGQDTVSEYGTKDLDGADTSLTLHISVDITNKDSGGNKTLLANGGIHSMSVSGSGVFTDAAVEENLRAAMNGTTFSNFQILLPDFGTYTGAFNVTSLEYAGEYNGEVTYSLSLESSGAITYATV